MREARRERFRRFTSQGRPPGSVILAAIGLAMWRSSEPGCAWSCERPLPRSVLRLPHALAATLLLALAAACSDGRPEATPPPATPEESGLPLPSSTTREEFQPLLYGFLAERRYEALGWKRDKAVRDTGPWTQNVYDGTHPAVRVHYSPSVIAWLRGGRSGPVPDGAMIVKAMYPAPAGRYATTSDASLPPPTWTVMIKDSRGSHDGWYWSYFDANPEGTTPATWQPVDDDHAPFAYPNSGTGQYCVRCHASAERDLTFAALENVEGEPGSFHTYVDDGSWRTPAPAAAPLAPRAPAPQGGALQPAFAAAFPQFAPVPTSEIQSLPGVTTDHVVVTPGATRQFTSSDQCMSCHTGDTSAFGPNMMMPPRKAGEENIDVSPFGEWRWSMMGLAGRDPVFYAQLDTEKTLHAKGDVLGPDQIQDLCFTCHGVMGKRQHALDRPGEPFREEAVLDPSSTYGALARDGVSCTVCHQLADNVAQAIPDIENGRFGLTPRTAEGALTILARNDQLTTAPMMKALFVKPTRSAFLGQSRLCASCHTVNLPVLDDDGKVTDTRYEQTTFLEWENSSFRDDGAKPTSCQSCHMPRELDGKPLTFKSANVQDQDFPETTGVAPLADVTVKPRGDYARHTLLGINAFALEMFNVFPDVLGVTKTSFMSGTTTGLARALENVVDLASTKSVRVDLLETSRQGQVVTSKVKVTNLTGHRFPSGVGFRRAFLAFSVADGAGNVVWASGRTNEVGMIVGPDGAPLPSELHAIDPVTGAQAFQPHHQKITDERSVQLFEELVRDGHGRFTTSFLSRASDAKDNRLMPLGWTFEGPAGFPHAFAEATAPVGEAASDADFLDHTGSDTLVYEATLPASAKGPFTVGAQVFYQAIPPGYLKDRFDQGSGPATRRLHHMASRIDTTRTSFPGWKLPLSGASTSVP